MPQGGIITVAVVVDDFGVTVVAAASLELCSRALEQEDTIIKSQQQQIKYRHR